MAHRYGSGSVYRRASDGRWVGAVRVAGKRRSVYGTSKSAVVERLREVRTERASPHSLRSGGLTVGDQLNGWLLSKRSTVRPSTWVSYEGHVRLHLASLSDIPLATLTPNHVRALIAERLGAGCAPRTVASCLTTLRMALKQAVGDGLLPRNVATYAAAPMVTRVELVVPSATEVERLFSLSTPLAPLWTLLVGSGLRLGEALGVRWSDVDLIARTLTVRVSLRPIPRAFRPDAIKGTWTHQRLKLVEPKTASSRRTIALPSFVVRALLAHRARHTQLPANILGLVFTTPRGTPLDQRNVSRAFAADCSKAALPHLRLHDLRHVAASLMLAQGASLDDVKRVLGHSSIALTSDTYGHLVEGRSREVADRLDRLFG